ncbi:MAG: ATP-binding protein [Sedimentisphaerales bacterium]
MIERYIKKQVIDSLAKFPVVGILGARQVGKTTLAKMVVAGLSKPAIHLDLERPSDLAKLDEAELYLEQHAGSLVVLDEVQRKPELFPLLRALVDSRRTNGQFLILGSASPAMIRQSSETLAGRIIYHELSPFNLAEVKPETEDINLLWSRGGFPRSFLAKSDEESFSWREAFIQTHLERDIPGLGLRVGVASLHRFWQMLAHCHGQLWNAAKIASSLGISATTVRSYLDLLQDTFMVRRLAPFHSNTKKRLVKSPKIYLRDSGLLHCLLKIQTHDDLLGHPIAGASWEGWVIEQVLDIIPSSWSPFFYRTIAGAELDLFIQRTSPLPPLAIEIKFSLEPKPAKGFWSAISDLQPGKSFVVYPGDEMFPLGNNVYTLPVARLTTLLDA